MNRIEKKQWMLLLSDNSISGSTKIKCIEKQLKLIKTKRHQLLFMHNVMDIISMHEKKEMDHSCYWRLEEYYPLLPSLTKGLKVENDWTTQYENPVRTLFKDLQIEFPFKKPINHRLKILNNHLDYSSYLRDEMYMVVLEFATNELFKLKKAGSEVFIKNEPHQKRIDDKLTFGFKGEKSKLKQVINELCSEIDLINEDINDPSHLFNILTSKDISSGSLKIQLNCETRTFRYCIDKFMPYFNSLSLANIEKSKIFYSKKDTLITANNLSASGSKNKIEPKEKPTIDKIFKHLQ